MSALTADQINALPQDVRDYIHGIEALCDPAGIMQENALLRDEVTALSNWVADLQSGMYINCVYCGHRYGPDPGTPVAMADVLKEHIAQCPKHPLSIMVKRNAHLVGIIHRMQREIANVIPMIEESKLGEAARFAGVPVFRLDAPWKESNRASGNGLCAVCRQPLKDHLMPMPESCPSMVEDCNGDWWKL
jgi:hypothetical protein